MHSCYRVSNVNLNKETPGFDQHCLKINVSELIKHNFFQFFIKITDH